MSITGYILFALLAGWCGAHREFQDLIPNGDHVPHPCKPNYVWRGVGHMNPLGGGAKNAFGEDFKAYKQWTRELCELDSDNDGMTNGEELGDPNCDWTQGSTPTRTTAITHPGICDPWGSEKCRETNKLVTCNTGEFVCPEINDPNVFNVTVTFPPTAVPVKETTYMCLTFELDMLDINEDYHLIATKPFINNPNVMHHTTLYGCGASAPKMDTPKECTMGVLTCPQALGVWTLGMPGECLYREAGIKFAKNGMRRILMEHHWTNPMLVPDYVDSSGMTLFFTRTLRPYNADFFSTGTMKLEIPPGEQKVVVESVCTSECTEKLVNEKIYIISGWNHMHYLGYSEFVELYRDGYKVRDLTPDPIYSYDNPIVHVFNPPVEVLPGDVLKTTCVFRSTSRTKTTYFGPGTFDEMCFGIFTYYPQENLRGRACLTHDDLPICGSGTNTDVYGCNFVALINTSHPYRQEFYKLVMDNCNFYGSCRKECPAAIEEAKKHPCMNGKPGNYIRDVISMTGQNDPETLKFLSAMASCECSVRDRPDPVFPTSGASYASGSLGFTTFVVIGFVMILSL